MATKFGPLTADERVAPAVNATRLEHQVLKTLLR